MDLATKNNERFIVDRRGEPAVVIMSVQDFIRTAAPPPDWLEKAWTGAKRRRGLDTLRPSDIDAEIAAPRRNLEPRHPRLQIPTKSPADSEMMSPGDTR